jgi:hypothetical protein
VILLKLHLGLAAVLVWALVGCAGRDEPEGPPESTARSDPPAACPGEVSAPYGSPSMMPVESGAPREYDATYIAPQWPSEIDTVTCSAAVVAVTRSEAFADRHGAHHIEVGTASPYSETKDPDCMTYDAACWSVDFYDYDEKSGFRAVVDSSTGGLLWVKPWPGVHVSQAEADRAIKLALQDPSVAEAYGDGSAWWHWLYEISPASGGLPCRVDRCISARTWRLEGGALLHVIVDLHREEVVWVELP